MPKPLSIATCQFPVSTNITRNAQYIRNHITQAKQNGAQVAHFSECALSGYAGAHFKTWDGYHWDLLKSETESILDHCKKNKIWAIIGSSHPLTGDHLPHNCQYIINNKGHLVDRYDKRHCSEKDLRFYAPGTHTTTFEIHGILCGSLICLEFRFPELYADYAKQNVWCLFQSTNGAKAKSRDIFTDVIPGTLQGHAANNNLWISHANASNHYQSFPSAFMNPSGEIKATCRPHRSDQIINTIDFSKNGDMYTFIRKFRHNIRTGTFYRDKKVRDKRSQNRTQL